MEVFDKNSFKPRTPPVRPERIAQTKRLRPNSDMPEISQQSLLFSLKSTLVSKHSLAQPLTPVLLKREGGDLEVSTGIHNVSFLSLFVLPLAPRGLCFTWARQRRHATLNLRSLPRRLLALSPPESANDRCYLRHRNLLQSGETYLPYPRWLFRIADSGRADLCSQPGGLDSLPSPSQSLRSQTFMFFFFFP